MWTRAELKTRAKKSLKKYYWSAVLTLIIYFLLSGITIVPPLNILVGYLLEIGLYSYFLNSERRQENAGAGELFHGFSGGQFLRCCGIIFCRNLFVFLWSLLLFIPGIIKSYEYAMVPYLAVDYPEKSRKEIFRMSKEMMDGNKMALFVLGLSFLGWILLGAVVCGVGLLLVLPYIHATSAELYLTLKEQRLEGRVPARHEVYDAPQGAAAGYESAPRAAVSADSTAAIPENVPVREAKMPQAGVSPVPSQNEKKGYLIGVEGEFTGANIPVDRGAVIRIGRDASKCNVVIQSPEVSRLHLTVEFDGQKFRVTDLSSFGTYNMQAGRLPKGQTVDIMPGTYLQLGTSADIFVLDCK